MEIFQLRLIDIYLLIVISTISLVLFAIGIFPKSRKKENGFFAFILVIFLAHLTTIALMNTMAIPLNVGSKICFVFNLVYGPLFLAFFNRALRERPKKWLGVIIWASIALIIPFFKWPSHIYSLTIIASFAGNLVLAINLSLNRGASTVPLTGWIKFALGFFALLSITYISETSIILCRSINYLVNIRFIYFTELMVLAGGFFFFSLRYPANFLDVKLINTARSSAPAFDPSAKTEISLLVQNLEQETLYRNPDLSRATLTSQTGIPSNRVSELINGHFGVNFSEWVNTYRIEEAKSLLTDRQQLTVQEIFYDVGFNSKSAFNKAFKKHTGQTPSVFREESRSKMSAEKTKGY